MCGRFTLTAKGEALVDAFPEFTFLQLPTPRYNIAPGTWILAVPNDGSHAVKQFLWGFVPPWVRGEAKRKFINARAETVATKPAFRDAFARRRCLVLADGFYEWRKSDKQPFFCTLKSREPFAIAGIWSIWHISEEEKVPTCALLTVKANAVVAQAHERMPAILPRAAWEIWLAEGQVPTARLQQWLKPYPAAEMTCWPVDKRVNNPREDDPALVKRLSRRS